MASTTYVVQRTSHNHGWIDLHGCDELDSARELRDDLKKALGEVFSYRLIERTETVIDD